MEMNSAKSKYITISLIFLLFVLSHFVIFSHLHFHILTNGFVIVHGHAFPRNSEDNSPATRHQHSQIDHLIINSIMSIDGFISLCFLLAIFCQPIYFLTNLKKGIVHKTQIFIPILRAPPAILACH